MIDVRNCGDIFSEYIKAGSADSAVEEMESLAKSKYDRIRLRVAENPNSPQHVLELLAKDGNPDVRVAVATNPQTCLSVSLPLALDEDPNVRLGLATDLSTPMELLEKLVDDVNPYISCRAIQTREVLLSKKNVASLGQDLLNWANNVVDGTSELQYA